MSVKVRLLMSLVLLLVGIGLPAFAIKQRGAPWTFQDRAAVMLSSTGNVEVYPGTERPAGAPLEAGPGLSLYPGDELRLGGMSRAVVRTHDADFELADGARVILGDGGRVSLARGLAWLGFQGARDVVVVAESAGAEIALKAGNYRLSADGHGNMFVLVNDGAASTTMGGSATAPKGSLLVLAKGAPPKTMPRPESVPLEVSIDVDARLVRGKTVVGAQLYLNGKLFFAGEGGAFSEALPPGTGEIVLFVRDPAGNVERRVLRRPSSSP